MLRFLSFIAIVLLVILPSQLFRVGITTMIFPATEIIAIYYLTIYRYMRFWHLFIVGFLLDALLYMPYGTNSLTFLLAYIAVTIARKWFILEDYIANISFFALYNLLVILSRYVIILIKTEYDLHNLAIYFYYLSTIFAYPLFKLVLDKLLPNSFRKDHARQ